ncbi:MAG: hypothetical protein K6F91_08205 [Ruminococcus sp.]|nr:hypothetical protein [Ruminococcus sp.]
MDNNTISTGNCGEYFVAAELERRGFTVAIPMSNVEDFDILAINRETLKQIAIQVKTNKTKNKKWILKSKAEKLIKEDIFYVFVVLNGLESPEYHIVPSKIVADTVSKSHKEWLNAPGKNGQKHNDSNMRKFDDVDNKFLDKWDTLKM